jgi:hypothetical protein
VAAGVAVRAGCPAAVVADVDLERVRAVAERHLGARGAGVAQRVRQRLLDDPVGRQFDPRRQRRRIALAPHDDLEAPGPERGGEVVEAVEAGLGRRGAGRGRAGLACLRAHRAQHAPQLAHRLPARPLDRAQRLAGLVRAGVEDLVGGGRLHDDDRDAVGDDVVQFARDPGLLLADRAPRGLVDRDPPAARRLAERPRPEPERHREQRVPGRGGQEVRGRDRLEAGEADQRHARGPRRGERTDGEEACERQHDVGDQGLEAQAGDEHDRGDEFRAPAPPPQRRALGGGEREREEHERPGALAVRPVDDGQHEEDADDPRDEDLARA